MNMKTIGRYLERYLKERLGQAASLGTVQDAIRDHLIATLELDEELDLIGVDLFSEEVLDLIARDDLFYAKLETRRDIVATAIETIGCKHESAISRIFLGACFDEAYRAEHNAEQARVRRAA